MNNLQINISKYQQPKKAPAYYFQEIALEVINYLDNPVKSEVFMWAKKKEGKLKSAISYMKEKRIKDFGYLITLMNL